MIDDFDTIKYENMKSCGLLYPNNLVVMILKRHISLNIGPFTDLSRAFTDLSRSFKRSKMSVKYPMSVTGETR